MACSIHDKPASVVDYAAGSSGTIYTPGSFAGPIVVDVNGLVAAVAPGSVNITVTNGDFLSDDPAVRTLLGSIRLTVGPIGDADNDGLPSDYETTNGLDPNDSTDADVDSDGDGLTGTQEFALGTLPNNPDTDSDSLLDGEEIPKGFDPLVADFIRLDESCTASVANRTIRVNPDGTFSLQNIPRIRSYSRVRVLCDREPQRRVFRMQSKEPWSERRPRRRRTLGLFGVDRSPTLARSR